jgi:hypothetical protein
MKKIQEKWQKIQVYKVKHQLPLKLSHMDGKPQCPPRESVNREESRGLVKMSANCLSVSIYLISMSPFSTKSLKKWCLLSTCLIFLWKTRFLATKMTLVLSHMRETFSNLTQKSLMVCIIQRICEQQLLTRSRWWTVQLKIVFEKTSNILPLNP